MGEKTGDEKNSQVTRVDLGEDLLKPQAPDSGDFGASDALLLEEREQKNLIAEETIEDQFQQGEILMGEKLLEDAKKVFRKILRREINHVASKKALEEIQRLEIQELLASDSSRKKLGVDAVEDGLEPTRVLELLDKDAHLNLDKLDIKAVPDLFESQRALDEYQKKIFEIALALPVQNRIDLGVAHLEIGLNDVAKVIFESVVRYEEHRLVGLYLLGLALIKGGQAIEATIRIEPIVREATLTEVQKTDFLYLMGYAFETLGDQKKAKEFYRRAYSLNPKYRDLTAKMK